MNVQEIIEQVVKQTGEYGLVGTQSVLGETVPDYSVDNGILYYVNKAVYELERLVRTDRQKKLFYSTLKTGEYRIFVPNLLSATSVSIKNSSEAWSRMEIQPSLSLSTQKEISSYTSAAPVDCTIDFTEYANMSFEEVSKVRTIAELEQVFGLKYLQGKFWVFGWTDETGGSSNFAITSYATDSFTTPTNYLEGIVHYDVVDIGLINRSDVGYLTLADGTKEFYFVVWTSGTGFAVYSQDEVLLYTGSTGGAELNKIECHGNTFLVGDTGGSIVRYRIHTDGTLGGTTVDVGSSVVTVQANTFSSNEEYIAVYDIVSTVYNLYLFNQAGIQIAGIDLAAYGLAGSNNDVRVMKVTSQGIFIITSKSMLIFDFNLDLRRLITLPRPASALACKGDHFYIGYKGKSDEDASYSLIEKWRFVANDAVPSILFNVPSNADYTVQVEGRFKPKELEDMGESNYWLSTHPYLVIDFVSHLIKFPRMSVQSNNMLWRQVQDVIDRFYKDEAEEEIAIHGGQIKG